MAHVDFLHDDEKFIRNTVWEPKTADWSSRVPRSGFARSFDFIEGEVILNSTLSRRSVSAVPTFSGLDSTWVKKSVDQPQENRKDRLLEGALWFAVATAGLANFYIGGWAGEFPFTSLVTFFGALTLSIVSFRKARSFRGVS